MDGIPIIRTASLQKPLWLKRSLPIGEKIQNYEQVRATLQRLNLHTVCEEAKCPNINECWGGGTATFMVMGDTCTRGCRFCAVKTRRAGEPLDKEEPEKLAEAVGLWGLSYVVITSVDRDDLPDQGAGHYAECIRAIKQKHPEKLVEVLIPDFRGDASLLRKIAEAKPEVIAHNIETVERLQRKARDPRAGYRQSLGVLENVKKMDPDIYTKSSIMLGIGETEDEVVQTMDDLRAVNCDVLTIGQYLQPTKLHLTVNEYVPPERFEFYKKIAEEKGFLYVASGPFVRTSYKAGEFFMENIIRKKQLANGEQLA